MRFRERGAAMRAGFSPASAITLFFPRVGMVVVAARLPVARVIVGREADAHEPLSALPEVQIRNERAGGGAMGASERGPSVPMGDKDVRAKCLAKGNVGRVAVRRLEDHMVSTGFDVRARRK